MLSRLFYNLLRKGSLFLGALLFILFFTITFASIGGYLWFQHQHVCVDSGLQGKDCVVLSGMFMFVVWAFPSVFIGCIAPIFLRDYFGLVFMLLKRGLSTFVQELPTGSIALEECLNGAVKSKPLEGDKDHVILTLLSTPHVVKVSDCPFCLEFVAPKGSEAEYVAKLWGTYSIKGATLFHFLTKNRTNTEETNARVQETIMLELRRALECVGRYELFESAVASGSFMALANTLQNESGIALADSGLELQAIAISDGVVRCAARP